MRVRLCILAVFLALVSIIGALVVWRGVAGERHRHQADHDLAVVPLRAIERVPYRGRDSFFGDIQPIAEVAMRFNVSGRIARYGTRDEPVHDDAHGVSGERAVPLREDDFVAAGTPLVYLEQERFELAIDTAQARLEQARANIAEARAAVEERHAAVLAARVNLADSESDLNAQRSLRQRSVITETEYQRQVREHQRREAMLHSAKALHRAAESRLEAARRQEQVAQQALRDAKLSLRDSRLEAPWDGTIAARPFDVGHMVSPQDVVLRLVAIDRVRLVLDVPQSRIGLFQRRLGSEVDVRVMALEARARRDPSAPPSVVRGTVSMVSPAADPVTRLFRVEIELDNSDRRLAPGMIAEAVLPGEPVLAMKLPAEAVRERDGKLTTYFVQRGFRVGLPLGELGREGELWLGQVFTVRRMEIDRWAQDKDHYLLTTAPRGVAGVVPVFPRDVEDGEVVRLLRDPGTRAALAASEIDPRQRLGDVMPLEDDPLE